MHQRQLELAIKCALHFAIAQGSSPKDEERFATIEAILRDALGQNHGVWEWRVNEEWHGSESLLAEILTQNDSSL